MTLFDFIAQVDGFDALAPREKIKLFGWHLHQQKGLETFGNGEIRECFRLIHSEPPDVTVYLPRMVRQGDLLQERGGYKLEGAIRRAYDARYGLHPTVVSVSKLLADLPAQIPDISERSFLMESLNCYRVGAYRAAIVMVWNLAFDHLLNWVLKELTRLSAFNAAIQVRYPKHKSPIATREDFEDLKEFEIIEVLYTSNLVSKNVADILKENLKRRNRAAHPSQVVIVQSQADDAITNLVNNIVLVFN